VDLQLQDRHVLVTGGTRGIGLAIAERFMAEGALVHLISRNRNETVLSGLEAQFPGRFYFYSGDVTDAAQLQEISKAVKQNAAQGLYALVCNVGSGRSVNGAWSDETQWDEIWNANFHSALHSCRVFSNLLEAADASILFISSIAGVEFIGAPTDYSVAKAALVALAKNLAHKMAPAVRVNAIAPGNIYFEGGTWQKKKQENPQKVETLIQEKVPLQRFGKPEEIADLAVFLSSPRAAFITGSCVVADGGQTVSF
jgi:3-oxoacyl-[acyl-carrier protein] reductase